MLFSEFMHFYNALFWLTRFCDEIFFDLL
jgi:hypothetical protein